MSQKKSHSLIESCMNTAVGFGVSLVVWMLVIVPVYDIPVTMMENLEITGIFTVVSIIRGYVIRRAGNWHYQRTNRPKARKLVAAAMDGDEAAIKEIADRLDRLMEFYDAAR